MLNLVKNLVAWGEGKGGEGKTSKPPRTAQREFPQGAKPRTAHSTFNLSINKFVSGEGQY
jgi:hypothetical protein